MNVPVIPMPGCPSCHIYKGLFSALKKSREGAYVCPANPAHKFRRDKDGNFHTVV